MKKRVLPNQISLDLFAQPETHEPPTYEQPCPIREYCGAYHCESGGCDGQRGWCTNAQNAYVPGKCLCETRKVGKKSFCAPWDRWTNCREVNHCVYAQYKEE